jgi:FKBP-type peptidyl-prolyl cis-trans isomerase
VFENLALGGDAVSDFGTPIVTSQDALKLAQQQSPPLQDPMRRLPVDKLPASSLRTTVLQRGEAQDCANIQSRRGDVLEVSYEARVAAGNAVGSDVASGIVYDSSESRGTGQPYQMVLGSGDMLPGVDLGLYDACPGERRRIEVPAALAYGARGNKLFRIPPDSDLVWTVDILSINSIRPGEARTRDEMEGRFEYR